MPVMNICRLHRPAWRRENGPAAGSGGRMFHRILPSPPPSFTHTFPSRSWIARHHPWPHQCRRLLRRLRYGLRPQGSFQNPGGRRCGWWLRDEPCCELPSLCVYQYLYSHKTHHVTQIMHTTYIHTVWHTYQIHDTHRHNKYMCTSMH